MEGRARTIGSVLERLALLSRLLLAGRHAPFGVNLSRAQLDALFHLAHHGDPPTPGQLATTLQITRGAVTQLVDGLQEAGLVDRRRNPDDARSSTLHLSAGARRRVDEFEAAVVADVAGRFHRLDDAELAQLSRLLDRIER